LNFWDKDKEGPNKAASIYNYNKNDNLHNVILAYCFIYYNTLMFK